MWGVFDPMPLVEERPAGPLVIGGVCLVLLAAAIVLLMPTLVGAMLALWLLLSIPIGIAVGHCALNRDE
jgi:hypothetical protein